MVRMAQCHPEREHHALDLCRTCYGTQRMRKRRGGGARKPADPNARKRALFRFRLKRYGLTEEDFSALLDAQNHRCAVCQEPLGDEFDIDHSHATGAVRGLLCKPCNKGLGTFGDSAERLRAAALYLERNGL